MSQFDFPRINFHGTAYLDTPTANNGKTEPALVLFDQEHSISCLPPRLYISKSANITIPDGVEQIDDGSGTILILITPINAQNYQQWAVTPLGQFNEDSKYHKLYIQAQINGMLPGYWNYWGDLSMRLNGVMVTGITIPDATNGTITYTPQNNQGCPPGLAPLLQAELSFNYLLQQRGRSQTSAYLCDVDSKGQMCTQIFVGTAGLYDKNKKPFLTGSPVKSTARFMNLTRVLNYVYNIPMGGSASFYSMIEGINMNTELAEAFAVYTGTPPQFLFMKLMIHEVYEVRNPDYSNIPVKTITNNEGNSIEVPSNPATVSISGSISPWYDNDMKTVGYGRILKASSTININTTGIPAAVTLPITSPVTTLPICNTIQLAPAIFVYNANQNLLSFDFSNTINEYGIQPANYPSFAGAGDIAPFTQFLNYDFGDLELMFQSDQGGSPQLIGTITYIDHYNMNQFLSTGGMVDFQAPAINFQTGSFFINSNATQIMTESEVFITSDQQGIYAEQNQTPANLYLADGLPLVPFIIRCFYRGVSVSSASPLTVTLQLINLNNNNPVNQSISVYDGMPYIFPVNEDGCFTYGLAYDSADLYPPGPAANGFLSFANYVMRANLIVLRVHAGKFKLDQYLQPENTITWEIIFNEILSLYKTLYPVMDAVLPMNEANWSDPEIQQLLVQFTDKQNWSKPLFMPVTRDMTDKQRQVLIKWINQSKKQL